MPAGSASGLLELTARLVDIPSVSHNETAMADHVESLLGGAGHLEVSRMGDNVLARTNLGRPMRLILAGHLDTVPANGNERAVLSSGKLRGLGSADMKGGLAVMLEVARSVSEPSMDLTFLGYVCEEVEQRFNGLLQLADREPGWLDGDAAILGEPTACRVEAGCQGVLNVVVELTGERAHTARPWMGSNAIHRVGAVLRNVEAFPERRPVIDGCEFREALQAVEIEGGVAKNVVPDRARVVLNHRFAPDREPEEAFAAVLQLLGDTVDFGRGDSVSIVTSALAAAPSLSHPLLASLVERSGAEPRAKLGWTDVSFFSHRGIPAANFGPGEPTLAHTADEEVSAADLADAYETLHGLVTSKS